MRHLFTLTLGGILGVCLMAGDAEACHKKRCGGGCGGQVVCAPQPVAYSSCGHRAKKCGGGGLCHKKRSCNSCAGPAMAYHTGYAYSGYSYAAPVASGQTYAAPQATGQTYGTPPVPSKR